MPEIIKPMNAKCFIFPDSNACYIKYAVWKILFLPQQYSDWSDGVKIFSVTAALTIVLAERQILGSCCHICKYIIVSIVTADTRSFVADAP